MKKDQRETGRGAKTMEQLLEAGLEAFARFGPDGVSTRQLAKMAGVNSAAIAYYFGSKEGYYLAVVRHLLNDRLGAGYGLVSQMLGELSESRTSDQAELIFRRMLHTMAIIVMTNPNAIYMASINTREQLHSTEAFELIYQDAVLPLHTFFSNVVGAVMGKDADDPEAIIRGHALLGQIIMFRVAATTICRRLGWEDITLERAEHIAGILVDMACRAIGLDPVPEEGAGKNEA